MDRTFDRREALVAMGAMGFVALAAACTRRSPAPEGTSDAGVSGSPAAQAAAAGGGTCALLPELTEGPFYLDVDLMRRDITEGRPGVPLQLDMVVEDASCRPIKDATVEIWHADAGGAYSGLGAGTQAADEERFLRGAQTTDAAGKVTFETIYPGWYQGRAVHIHLKVHPGGKGNANRVHTGQVFFEDAVNDRVATRAPYSSRGRPDRTNGSDGIFGRSDGKGIVAVTEQGDGYLGRVTLAVQA